MASDNLMAVENWSSHPARWKRKRISFKLLCICLAIVKENRHCVGECNPSKLLNYFLASSANLQMHLVSDWLQANSITPLLVKCTFSHLLPWSVATHCEFLSIYVNSINESHLHDFRNFLESSSSWGFCFSLVAGGETGWWEDRWRF